MSMTDPIADMLTRIRNGITSRKARVQMPESRLKTHIAKILQDEGFIEGYSSIEAKPQSILQIDLKWTPDHRPAIEGLRRISRPGQRCYVGKEAIPKVRGGQGIAILTTSIGVMSDRDARRNAVGGEILCEVW
ncbi:MAG: 30S ribosomal protein S8 [Deltaproteobacteria bacterium]|nr:30S ribosomal protein S8 [Deltaproteobacteria bacterium]